VEQPVQSAVLVPAAEILAVGTVSGRVLFQTLPELAQVPVWVTAVESCESRPTFLQRLLGRERPIRVLRCTCPICHRVFELTQPGRRTAVCPDCHRRLHVNPFTIPADEQA